MDLGNPLRSIAPTVEADVLEVLSRTYKPLSARKVHILAGRSYSQVLAVLARLVAHGLVNLEHHGTTGAYVLNRNHVLADLIAKILSADDTVADSIAGLVATFATKPVSILTFGSFARRDGDEHSDIDLLVIVPEGIPQDSAEWRLSMDRLAAELEAWTGNTPQVVALTEAELKQAIADGEPLANSLHRDAAVVFGSDDILAAFAAPAST